MYPDPTSSTSSSSTDASSSVVGTVISSEAANAVPAATTALGLAESKAEEYALDHLFGMTRGAAFYAVLSGNATVQSAVTAQNLKAVTWLEALFLKLVEPALLTALQKVGLA